MYKLFASFLDGQVVSINRISDGVSIPLDPDNSDYAEYLKWLEAGNTPLPPDTQPE